MAEKKRLGRTAKIVIAVVVVLIVFGAIGSGGNNGSSSSASSASASSSSASPSSASSSSTSSTESSMPEESSSASSQASESTDEVKFDELQETFLKIGEDTTAAELKAMADEHGWALGEYQHKSSKYTHYILAYESGVAKEKCADDGPCLEVDISDDGKCSGIQYSDDSVLLATVLGSGLIHDATAYDGYGFGERDSSNNVKYGSREEALRAYVTKMDEVIAERVG